MLFEIFFNFSDFRSNFGVNYLLLAFPRSIYFHSPIPG